MKQTALLLPLIAALAACHPQPAEQAPREGRTLTVDIKAPQLTAARIVLPAVKGNPAAAYFTLEIPAGTTPGREPVAGTRDYQVTITRISVEGAGMAMMHETRGGEMAELKSLTLKPGEKISFAPGGKHVMLFDLGPKLVAGGTTELSVWFADGSRAIAKAKVEAPGGGDAMGGMDMGQHH